jgi:hypothetical protein
MRRSAVLSLSLQLVFLALSLQKEAFLFTFFIEALGRLRIVLFESSLFFFLDKNISILQLFSLSAGITSG